MKKIYIAYIIFSSLMIMFLSVVVISKSDYVTIRKNRNLCVNNGGFYYEQETRNHIYRNCQYNGIDYDINQFVSYYFNEK